MDYCWTGGRAGFYETQTKYSYFPLILQSVIEMALNVDYRKSIITWNQTAKRTILSAQIVKICTCML